MDSPVGVCFARLNNRCITANPYQKSVDGYQETCSGDQTVALVKHLDLLSTTLQRANEEAAWLSDMITVKYMRCGFNGAPPARPFENIGHLTVHRMLTTTTVAPAMTAKKAAGGAGVPLGNGDSPPGVDIGVQVDGGSLAPLPQGNDTGKRRRKMSVSYGKSDDDEGRANKSTTKKPVKSKSMTNPIVDNDDDDDDESAQAEAMGPTDDHDDRRRQPSSWTNTAAADSSVTDSKGQSKMLKLCWMLKNNIAELGALYDRRRQSGYAYTDVEKGAMGANLHALEMDVMRLMKTIEECRGQRRDPAQLKCIVDAYKKYESEYRALRTMNKEAKKRNEQCGGGGGGKCRTGRRQPEQHQNDNCSDDFTVKSVIEKYVCRPCYNLYRNNTGKK